MSDADPPVPSGSPPEQIPQVDGPPDEMALAKDIVELEHRRTDVEAAAIAADNERDKRLSDFYTTRITLADNANKRLIRLAYWVLGGVFVFVAAPLALFLFMAFWGDAEQKQTAIDVVTIGGIGVAGYGIIAALIRAVRSLFDQRNRPR